MIAFDVCPGFPCGLLAVDPATAEIRPIAQADGPAALGGPALVFRHGGHLVVLDTHTGAGGDVAASDDYEPVPGGSSARAGIDATRGMVSLRPSAGRSSRPPLVASTPPRPPSSPSRCCHEPDQDGAAARSHSRSSSSSVSSRSQRSHTTPTRSSRRVVAQNMGLSSAGRASGTPPDDMKIAIQAARDDANACRKSKAPTFAYAPPRQRRLLRHGRPCGINGLACMRRNPPGKYGVWFRENGHRFDWGTLRWCELSGGPDGCYQVRNVMLDELGHVLVLDHHENFGDDRDYDDAVVQTYSRTKPKAGWNAHAFGRCDVATLQQQYDVPSASALYSTCLDVPTELSIAASRSSVAAGAMVTFTAALGSDGTGKLSNNAVSGRTMALQQRLASGWSDLATMAPGSAAGTYVTSLNVWATRDYRAVFRKPANEGLRASSSAAQTVTVSSGCQAPCPQSAGGPAS